MTSSHNLADSTHISWLCRHGTWLLLLLAWAGLAFDELVKSEIALAIAVESDDGDRTHAAKKLGISRCALIYKLRVIEAEAK